MTIRLSFGTAGIRAQLGPGLDQINLYTVGGVAHALCSHLREVVPEAAEAGLCVAFDGRTDSDRLAGEIVRVARQHGFLVRVFERPTPTPLLAFATRHSGAAAGVTVTASHNPPADNGIKIYLAGGAQVLAPHDAAIARRIAAFDPSDLAGLVPTAVGRYEVLGEALLAAYLDTITSLVAPSSSSQASSQASSQPLRIAYSALCGVGTEVTRQVFARAGVRDVLEVEAQATPRADFGGLSSPNPEHASALAQLMTLSEQAGVELAFAHDPDADRLAVIARDRHGKLRTLSGDEVGALLGDFLLSESAEPERALLVSTLVSGELLERIAAGRGARFERTPTGFKWIASRARSLAAREQLDFLFGYEEAIGYAFGRIADDKDGIAALYVLIELARRLQRDGRSLCTRLDELARQHGVFLARQLTVPRTSLRSHAEEPQASTLRSHPEEPRASTLRSHAEEPRASTAAQAGADLLMRLRQLDASDLLGPGTTRIDYAERPERSDLLVFRNAGRRLCVRPSGTEPKLKLYLHAHAAVGERSLESAELDATRELDILEARLRAL